MSKGRWAAIVGVVLLCAVAAVIAQTAVEMIGGNDAAARFVEAAIGGVLIAVCMYLMQRLAGPDRYVDFPYPGFRRH
jgi:predicted membrane-bound mannosyltransferase